LITYKGVTGWVWAPWYNPASGSPCSDLPLTAWPTFVPGPTATPAECIVAPSDVSAADHNVYAGPAETYPVIGTVATGVYVTATGIFSPENYGSWVRVNLNGMEGWVDAGAWMFGGGGCWPLPVVDFFPHPPTFTPSPTDSGPTPTATDTPTPTPEGATAPTPQLEFGWSVPGDIGTTQTLSETFPSQGSTSPTHHLVITVTGIPQGDGNDSRRVVDFTLTCIGSGSLKWGWRFSPGTFGCGDTTRMNALSWSTNSVDFLIQAAVTGADTLTYIMTVTFSAYTG
jgi:hypothetical protein